MNTLISVIVPIFRVEKYLNRCVESLIGQTYENLEIILVDDGSDDNCPALCDEWSTKDDRIKVVHRENGGLSAARNSGIKVAKGKYLAFIDSDDCISKFFLEYLYRAIVDTSSDIAQCNYVNFCDVLPEDKQEYFTPVCFTNKEMLHNLENRRMAICSVVAWSKLYEKSLFDGIEYTEGKLHEDEFTTYKLFDKAKRIAFIDTPLYYYFQNSNSITGAKMNPRRLDGIDALMERFTYYRDKSYTDLTSKTACHIIENFIVHSRKTENDVKDFDVYKERISKQYKQAKELISPDLLPFHDRVVFKGASTFKAFGKRYRFHTKLRGVSSRLNLSKCYYKLKSNKKNKGYKKELEALFKGYVPEKTAFILGSIEYENLGDHAIIYAQKRFIQRILPDFKVIEIRAELYEKTTSLLKEKISDKSVLTIPGGGNMGDVWFDDERRRRSVIENFPNNRIIVFPQTISYSDTKEGKAQLEASCEIYNAHKNLYLFAREKASFEKMKHFYGDCNVISCPDIVLSMENISEKCDREGIGLCIRSDKERAVSAGAICDLLEKLSAENIKVSEFSTMADGNVSLSEREEKLTKLWHNISSYKMVVTDRLHGMIFCYLTATPCVVLDNSNHKIESIYNQYLGSCDFIKFTDEEHLQDDVAKMYKTELDDNETQIEFDYDELKRCLLNE